jgi:hypothetical protein
MASFTQFAFTTLSLLLALATNVHGKILHAKRVLQHLDKRTVFYGGYSLAYTTCSADQVTCDWPACCPAATVCDGTGGGSYCCPDCKFPFGFMNYLLIASQPTIAVRLWTVFQFVLIPAGQYGKVMALGLIILMAPMSFPSIFVAKPARLGCRD